MSSPPPHHTLFLSTHDFLDVPGSASGECGNNRPERRKRVIFEAVTGSGRLDRFTVVDVGEGVLPINADTTCGVHEEGAFCGRATLWVPLAGVVLCVSPTH